MNLSNENVLSLAPDASSANAGKKLATFKQWKSTGRTDEALWGECQGSALYQVRIDLGDMTSKCSCPSRKFPCKHALGLLLLAANSLPEIKPSTPPDWVAEWLSKRDTAKTKREDKAKEPPPEADDPEAGKKTQRAASRTAAKRATLVKEGIDALDLWMSDLMRNGLAGVETKPDSFWEDQAARLVDAQAPGLATRIRDITNTSTSHADWPEHILHRLGRIAMLTHAYRRIDDLDAAMQDDVRTMIGWTVNEDEVRTRGETLADSWLVLGERVTVEKKLHSRATWLQGQRSGRFALVLQYAFQGKDWGETFISGTVFDATLVFWPSAFPQRALVSERASSYTRFSGRTVGLPTLDAFLDSVGAAIARQPWLDTFPGVLRDVVPAYDGTTWVIQDTNARAVPLAPGDHWALLALAGGAPVDLARCVERHMVRPTRHRREWFLPHRRSTDQRQLIQEYIL